MKNLRAGSISHSARGALAGAALGALLSLGALAPQLAAQRSRAKPKPVPTPQQTVILRGSVVRQDSVSPAPYASVELVEAHARHLSDDAGRFSFKIAPGTYHVLVRQLGFAARDTVVTISDNAPPADLKVVMDAITIKLTDVSVRAAQSCSTPGVDTAATPVLGQFMADIRQNADREMLLRKSYPFEYTVEDVRTNTLVGSPDSSHSGGHTWLSQRRAHAIFERENSFHGPERPARRLGAHAPAIHPRLCGQHVPGDALL